MELGEYGNIDFNINPKFNWDKFDIKDPLKIINFEKTTFNIKFNKDFSKQDIKLKIEIDGNTTIFNSGVNETNLQISPEISGVKKLKDSSSFDYKIGTKLKVSQNVIDDTTLHLGWNKSLKNKDVKISLDINGNLTNLHSEKGSATFKVEIRK